MKAVSCTVLFTLPPSGLSICPQAYRKEGELKRVLKSFICIRVDTVFLIDSRPPLCLNFEL